MSEPASPVDCSIVVIALAGGAALEACLARLAADHDRCHVILGEGMESPETWQARFPRARFSAGRGSTVPIRRLQGIEAAAGPIVALLEDTSLPAPGWLEAAGIAFASDTVAAASGPVGIDPALAPRAQALACTEYGRFLPERFARLALGAPDARGTQAVSRLPGNNLAYRRSLVLELLAGEPRGLLESDVNERLKARGYTLALQPGMAVTYAAPDPAGIRLGTRLHHGRIYAGQRAQEWGYPARLACGAGALLLPAVLSARGMASMVRAVRPGAWLRTASWICLMESAWALGEGLGYLGGSGRSLDAWR